MTIPRIPVRALAAVLLLAGCGDRTAPVAAPAPVPKETRPAGFVDRVWSVSRSSSVEPGTLYVFLSEGTLVIASAHGKPMLGSWKKEANGELTMIEEEIPYRTEILKLTPDELAIRSHNPGEPVDITLVPAESPPP